ncbi:MAG: glycosyltransferase [Planktomarina sp.]
MIQVIGYLRFSYPGRSDARLTHDADPDRLRQRLYNTHRMEQRFHLFEHICLPSMDAQTDQNFKLLILIANDMPAHHRDRLDDLLVGRPYVELITDATMQTQEAFNHRAGHVKRPNATKIVHFRLDDDDALSSHYIQNIRTMAKRAERQTILSMSRGIMLAMIDGEVHLVEETTPYIPIGWALVLDPKTERNPFQAAPFHAATRMQSMVDPRNLSYIHTVHAGSDSKQGADRTIRAHLKRFGRTKDHPDYVRMIEAMEKEFPCFTEEYLRNVRATIPRGPNYDLRLCRVQ